MAAESSATEAPAADSGEQAAGDVKDDLRAVVDRLEGRLRELAAERGQQTLDDTRRTVQEHPLTALLGAIGIGLLLGLILGGIFGRGR